jgi:hypothetical protein
MSINFTTKLDAVNTLLFTIGETPVNTLSGGTDVDAVTAEQVIDRTSRAVQSHGWDFNHEPNFPLAVQAFAPYEIFVPDTALTCDPSDKYLKVTQRGNRLYDVANHTYSFSGITKIECDITWMLPFDELPETARSYIATRAARIFQAGSVGSDLIHSFTQQDEAQARIAFRRANTRAGDKNFLHHSSTVSSILQR